MTKRTVFLLILLFAALTFLIIVVLQQSTKTRQAVTSLPSPTLLATPVASSSAVLGTQTKTVNCIANAALPDRGCTPGAIFPTATKDQICQYGYAKSVRDVPKEEKDQVYAEYNILSHTPGQYEVDHLISLELGGSNDVANLWPEAAEPKPGFHEKDIVENYLHNQVCNGNLSLQQAQQQIVNDWLAVYKQIAP